MPVDMDALMNEVQALRGALIQEEQARLHLEAQRQADVRHLEDQLHGLRTTKADGAKPSSPKVTFSGDPLKWYDFRREFQAFHRFVGWTDLQAKGALQTCMRGEAHYAISCLDDLAADRNVTCEQLLEAYERRFVPEAASDVAVLEYDRAVQGPNESIQAFHGRVRHLYFRAHTRPGHRMMPEEDILSHLVKSFTKGLRRKAFRLAVRRAAPNTYTAALEAAQREYSALAADDITVDQSLFATNTAVTTRTNHKKHADEPMDVNAMQERRQPSSRYPCRVCNSPKHWKNECPQLATTHQKGRGAGITTTSARGRTGNSRGNGRGGSQTGRLRYMIQALEELDDTGYVPEDEHEAATILAMAEEAYEETDGDDYEDSAEDLP